jgi:hypothetical protein
MPDTMKDVPDMPLTAEERLANPINAPLLLSHVMERALKDYMSPVCFDKKGRDVNGKSRDEANTWVNRKGDSGVTSFNGICLALGLDANSVRGRLLEGKVNFRKEG